ncbi:PTS sugar transporter subunit IIA [Virgibacillus salarius]|nr:PTS glucose transporter subunit IIA [Priestia megaterium]
MILSPVNGRIIQVFLTKHALGMLTDNGVELLIHIGLEAVQLKGKGFTFYVKEGDNVSVGGKLIDFDIVEEQASSTIIPLVLTNTKEMTRIKTVTTSEVIGGKGLVSLVSK